MTGRRDVDEFLDRSGGVLDAPTPEPPAACAWCSHPLDDASPSRDFCGEHCAHNWRMGLDWFPEERCACLTCDPDGARHRPRTDPLRTAWIDMGLDWFWDDRAVVTSSDLVARGLEARQRAIMVSGVWEPGSAPQRVMLGVTPAEVAESVLTEYFRDLSHDLPPAPYPRWLADRVTEPGPTFVTPFDEVVTYETGERSP